jgi:hypothetical protein
VPSKCEGIKLTIDTLQNITDYGITINVSLENNSIYDFYVLDKRYGGISRGPWNLEIFFQDTIRILPNWLSNPGRMSRESYVLIKSGHSYIFHQNVYTPKYGEYSVKLSYDDRYLYRGRALKGRIESNVLKVIYKP